MKFYTVPHLSSSANQSFTPEGFLVCHNVPIGRVGSMLYVDGEVPVDAGPDGIIKIDRDEAEVFNDRTIASFQGKAVTLDHPSVDVGPENWMQLARGTVQNVRRGEGIDNDVMLADLLVTEKSAIESIRSGLREVSSGYDADYEQLALGHGRQKNIIGNHVALVEKGRCGSRCAIGDKDMATTTTTAAPKKHRWTDLKSRITDAFKAKDEATLEELLAEEPEPDDPTKGKAREETPGSNNQTSVEDRFAAQDARINSMDAKLDRILDARGGRSRDDEEETPEEKRKREERERAAARDAAVPMPSATEIQDVRARAEILSPGIQLPTFDAAATPVKVRDSLCALRRQALGSAFATDSGKRAILPFLGGNEQPNFQTMTCDALASAFIGSSEILKRENNYSAISRDAIAQTRQTTSTIQEINKRNADFWSGKR